MTRSIQNRRATEASAQSRAVDASRGLRCLSIQLGLMLLLAAIVLFAVSKATWGQGGQSNGQGFLPPGQVAGTLADGRPWSGVMQNGRKATMTLNPDGTGSFRGPMTFSATWTIQGEDFCIKIRMAGTRCLRFRRVAGGFEGWRGDEPVMMLTR